MPVPRLIQHCRLFALTAATILSVGCAAEIPSETGSAVEGKADGPDCRGATLDAHGYCRSTNGRFTFASCCEPEPTCEAPPQLGCIFGAGTRAMESLGYLSYGAGGGPDHGDSAYGLEAEQILAGMTAAGYEHLDTVEDAINATDDGLRFNEAYDPATGESYLHLEWYGGDNEVGAIFRAGTTEIVALIGDGDIYQCTAHVPNPAADACTDGPSATEAVVRRVLADNGIEGSPRINFPSYEVYFQLPWGEAPRFSAALDAALKSFIEDGEDYESPRALLLDSEDDRACPQEDHADRVRCYLAQPESYLAIVSRRDDPEDDIYPPEHGESIEDNWVFYLRLPNLSDHLFWAVVPNEYIGDVQNYGFN